MQVFSYLCALIFIIMKQLPLFLTLTIALLTTGCNNTYSDLLKAEKKLIDSYIDRSSTPYHGVSNYDYFYFYQTLKGPDSIEVDGIKKSNAIALGDRVLIRYRKYGLEAYTDTISYWSTDDGGSPITFVYDFSNSTGVSCTGWHVAISQMGTYGSECKIICPSKLGFNSDNATVTPYGYDLHVEKHPL